MGNRLDKFLLLMWKNWILIRRGRIRTLFEITIPVLLMVILVIIRGLIKFTDHEGVEFRAYSPLSQNINFREIAFSPSNVPWINNTMAKFVQSNYTTLLRGLPNSSQLDDYLFSNNSGKVGIQFPDHVNPDAIPSNLEVTLRFPSMINDEKDEWFTTFLFPPFQVPGPRDYDSDNHGDLVPRYSERGFLTVQQQLTYFIMDEDPATLPELLMQRYPYPRWNTDVFYTAMENAIGMFMILSFMLPYINTIRSITVEKEKQLKESMKIMGLPGWLHWTAWFCRTFLLLILVIVLMIVVLKVNFAVAPVFQHSDGFLLFILFVIYGCTTITFSFLISVFFSKANTAAAFGGIIWFLSYIPYALMDYNTTAVGAKLGAGLFSNTAMPNALLLILKFEAIEEGCQWSNLFKTVSPDDDLTLGYILLLLIVDGFLYLLVALYVEAIFPGDFGVPLPWYFLFTPDYWRGNKTHLSFEKSSANEGEFFEPFVDNLPAGIQIKNLGKTFGAHDAVKNLNLDLYEGQITVLLGHNGAGKTTTMSMLTGMFPPTRGTALVAGHDIRTNIEGVRDSMGLCLQHNVLFDELTVREHLFFFGKLKGLKSAEINQEIDKYIKLLELEDKRNSMISSLSGGMKRKISVGIALCGKSKVVMLDEPTAGMDPSARRAIWDILQQQKHSRTILLTTHFMDEADLLGDRIAIMSAGLLQCCGSSFFLKKKYGAGYYLIIDKSQHCVAHRITNLLKKHIPTIEIESNVGSELTYLLPENESDKFEKMLHELEQNTSQLEIRSYGVSLTTMEEVFMKVGADHDNKDHDHTNNHNGNDHTITLDSNGTSNMGLYMLEGFNLVKNQVLAMTMKRLLSVWRSWILFALQIILPVALVIITAVSPTTNLNDNPPLTITLDSYFSPVTLLEGGDSAGYYQEYKNLFAGSHELKIVPDINNYILNYTEKYPSDVKLNYIIGASFTEQTVTAWYNGEPYHSPPLTLSVALNTFYKKIRGSDHSISFVNHPLPYDIDTQVDSLSINVAGYQYAIQLGYGMAFVSSFYIMFYIRERVCKSKHLQFVSGTKAYIFWGISYLCDLATFLLTIIAIIITMAIVQEEGFSSADDIGRLTLILFYYGCCSLPLMYIASYFFSIPSTGFSRMMLLGAIIGIIGLLVIQVLEIESLDLKYVATPLHWILLFVPFYSISRSIFDLSSVYNNRKICQFMLDHGLTPEMACLRKEECCGDSSYFDFKTPGIGGNTLIAFFLGFVLFVILLANEYGLFSYVFGKIMNPAKPPIQPTELDTDVNEENKKIKSSSISSLTSENTLVLRDVTKYYKEFLAVNGLCLAVKPYECFGLLGVNGAGKTTTFKMMTGDEKFSYGEAWLNGTSVTKQQKEVQKYMGYCPQFDALLDDLTARETLIMYGLIRGIPRELCNDTGERLAHEFDFFKHLDKKVKELSGGNKRKLSTSLSLIGDPPVIFLDEPTTGMDPATKRYLWDALCKLRDNGKCIILTSHSMEECEAMCTRLAIMVNGIFQCLGSTQRLKNKFAQGYALTIKIKKRAESLNADIDSTPIENFVQFNFPGAILKEKYRELLSYQLPTTTMPWSQMFGILERSKRELNIEDYSLGQCSLEQVFLSFTKYQR